MHIRTVSDFSECKRLWEKFTPNKTIWDDWGVRCSLYNEQAYEILFLVTEDESGLLPLWFDKSDKTYYFFGGLYPEDIEFWFDKALFPAFVEALPTPARLSYIAPWEAERIGSPLIVVENRSNRLPLTQFEGKLEAYLATFGKKHRKNFLTDLRKLSHLAVSWDGLEHFELFAQFNAARFGAESDFADAEFTGEIRSLFAHCASLGKLLCCAIRDGERVVGVEYAVFYNGVYTVLNGGYAPGIPNLGKLLIFEHIKKAFALDATLIDFLSGEDKWKELWNFHHGPYYSLRKL